MLTQISRVSTKTKRRAIGLAAVAMLTITPAAPAVSADHTEPVPEITAVLEFVLGEAVFVGQLTEYASAEAVLTASFGGLEEAVTSTGNVRADWLIRRDHFGAPSHVLALGEVAQGEIDVVVSVPRSISDYDGDAGGGAGRKHSWYVGATDYRHGVHNELTVGAQMQVFQEDGTDLTMERPDANITTKGPWRESFCDCWLGGKVLRTSKKWARMTYTFEASEDQVVAIVMPMAPNRGKAKIKVDGVRRGTVDTYSPTRDNRIVVWQTEPLEAGVHTITVINLATEGRPRIDVDAFLRTQGYVDPVWHLR